MSEGMEAKKQQFKGYLDKTGAIDQISKILVKLFDEPEKPSNTVEYMMKFLGVEESADVDSLLKEFQAATEENIKLKRQIELIKKQIDQIKGV